MRLQKCSQCGSYTMKESCCGIKAFAPKPAKYSPEDTYGAYRRTAKESALKEKGLL